MTLSQEQRSRIADALYNHQKEVEFIKKSVDEQLQERDTYNFIKDQETDYFNSILTDVAINVRDNLNDEIDRWVNNKKLLSPLLKDATSQDNANDDKLTALDLLFLTGMVGMVNRTVSQHLPNTKIQEIVSDAYNEASTYYTKTEFQNLLEYLKGEGYAVRVDADGNTFIKPPESFGITAEVQAKLPTSPKFSIWNSQLSTRLSEYTIGPLKTVGEKYYPAMEKIIKEGYKSGTSIDDIAKKLKNLIDPESSSNKTYHIYDRIAKTEMAWYTERAKLDAFDNMGIKKVRFLTRMDFRVCSICQPLNMQVFDINGLTYIPPLHPRCRCCLSPVYEEDAMFALLLPELYSLIPAHAPINV